jgi:hypothetical protein
MADKGMLDRRHIRQSCFSFVALSKTSPGSGPLAETAARKNDAMEVTDDRARKTLPG